MSQQLTPISTARLLLQHDLHVFESRTLADLLGIEMLTRAQIQRLAHL
jgi:hypothetical protein